MALSATFNAPPPPPSGIGGAPPALPTAGSPVAATTLPKKANSFRLNVAHWMEDHLGKAYVPVAALAGGALGGAAGFFTLGPIGGIAGALGGGFLGAALVFSD